MKPWTFVWMLPLSLLCSAPTGAEVVDRSATGFTLTSRLTTKASADAAYAALAQHVAEWWDAAHTYSGDARNLSLIAQPGGCFCETLPDRGGVQHGTVVYVAPGKLLRMQAALGPLQEAGVAGSLTWQFEPATQGTAITMTYSVGGYMRGGLDKVADAVDTVLTRQLQLLQTYSDKAAAR